MKKILIILAALLLLLVAAIIILPLFFQGKIKELVKNKANEQIAAVLDFDDVGLSLIKHFPRATVTIDNLSIVNREPFAGDTLLALSKLEGTVNLGSLIGGGPIEIVSVYLIEPRANLKALKDGRVNWQVMAQTSEVEIAEEDTTASTLSLAIREYEINDGRVSYVDDSTGIELLLDGLTHSGSGDFGQSQFRLSTRTEITAATLTMQGVTYLNRTHVDAKADIDVDLDAGKYTLADNEMRLNDLALTLNGWAAQIGEDMQLDLTFAAPDANLKNLLSMVPYIYQQDFADLTAEGALSLQGQIKGVKSETRIPSFDVKVGLQSGRFKYAQLPTPIEQVKLDLQISCPGGTLDNTQVGIDALHLEILDKPIDVRGLIKTPISDPRIDLTIKGSADLEGLITAFPLEEKPDLRGLVNSQLQIHGNVSAARKGQMDRFEVSGRLGFSDIDYGAPDLPDRLKVSKADINFSPQRVSLDVLSATVGKSDLKAQGVLENVVGYIFADRTLKGTLAVYSQYFDLNPWIQGESGGLRPVELPGGVEFLLQADFRKVTFENLDLTNVTGSLQLKDKTLNLLDLKMNTLQGSLAASGRYVYQPPQQAHLFLDAAATELSIPVTYEKMVTVQRFAPIANYLTGSYSGKINIDSDLDGSLMPVWQDFFSSGELSIPKANLQDFLPLNKVADALQLSQLKNPALQNLDPTYLIKAGRFTLKPIAFAIDQYQITASGSNGLDKSIDYLLKVQIPAAELKNRANATLSRLIGSDINALTNETVIIDVYLGGTLTNPTVKTSLSEIVKGTGDQLKDAAAQEADRQKAEAERKLQDEMDQQKQELEKKKKEAEQKLKDKLKGLLGKP